MNDTTMIIIGIIMMLAGIAAAVASIAADKARAAKQDRELAEAIKRGGK